MLIYFNYKKVSNVSKVLFLDLDCYNRVNHIVIVAWSYFSILECDLRMINE